MTLPTACILQLFLSLAGDHPCLYFIRVSCDSDNGTGHFAITVRILNSSGDSEINVGLLKQSQGCSLSMVSVGSVRLCSWPSPADLCDPNRLPSIRTNPSSPSHLTLVMTVDSLMVTVATGSRCQDITVFGSIFLSVIQALLMSLTLTFHSLPLLGLSSLPHEPIPNNPFLYLFSCFFPGPSLPPVLSNLKNGGFNSRVAWLVRAQITQCVECMVLIGSQKMEAILPMTALHWF